jgi:hypothetical protein
VFENEYSFPSLSTIFKVQILFALCVYGLYVPGHLGIAANIDDCNTDRFIADVPKYV